MPTAARHEALRHLTHSTKLGLRRGSRVDAFCTYGNAARLSLDLGRVEDTILLAASADRLERCHFASSGAVVSSGCPEL